MLKIGERLSDAPDFWPAYRLWRLRALAQPFGDAERLLSERVATALQGYAGFAPDEAARQARRYVLFRRDRAFHEMLTLGLAPERLHWLLDAIATQGTEHLSTLPSGAGVLFLSFHYSVYSSLLCLWLNRLAAGRFRHLAILVDTGQAGPLGFPADRLAEVELGGLGRPGATILLDLRTTPGAAHHLVTGLRSGGAALVFPDTAFAPAGAPGTVPLTVGRRTVGLPGGTARLARLVGCPIVGVHLRPAGDGYALVFEPPAVVDGPEDVSATLHRLAERTILADPGPWDGWSGLPRPTLADRSGKSYRRA